MPAGDRETSHCGGGCHRCHWYNGEDRNFCAALEATCRLADWPTRLQVDWRTPAGRAADRLQTAGRSSNRHAQNIWSHKTNKKLTNKRTVNIDKFGPQYEIDGNVYDIVQPSPITPLLNVEWKSLEITLCCVHVYLLDFKSIWTFYRHCSCSNGQMASSGMHLPYFIRGTTSTLGLYSVVTKAFNEAISLIIPYSYQTYTIQYNTAQYSSL